MNLPDSLMEQVRKRAESDRQTVTSVVEEALREWLARDGAFARTKGICRPTARPGVTRWSTSFPCSAAEGGHSLGLVVDPAKPVP